MKMTEARRHAVAHALRVMRRRWPGAGARGARRKRRLRVRERLASTSLSPHAHLTRCGALLGHSSGPHALDAADAPPLRIGGRVAVAACLFVLLLFFVQ